MTQVARVRDKRAKDAGALSRERSTQFADAGEVADLAKDMKQAHLDCRDVGHSWRPWTAQEVRDEQLGRHWVRTLRCRCCRAKRTQVLDRYGSIVSSSYSYADGYMNKGLGRIAGEARDVLRAENLRRQTAKGR